MSRSAGIIVVVLLVLSSFMMFSCQAPASKQSQQAKDGVVLAKVGPLTITETDLTSKQDVVRFGEKEREKVIEDMIKNKLIYLAAIDEKFDQDPEVKARMQEQAEKILGQIYLNARISNLNFSDEQLKKYYAEHQAEFKIPRKASLAHILLSSRDLAQRVQTDINDGKISFEQAVLKYSEDKLSSRSRGKLGMVVDNNPIPSLGDYPDIAQKIFEAREKEIIGPFETAKGFHLLLVEKIYAEEVEDFERAKRKIIDTLAVSASEIEAYYDQNKDERFKKKAFVKVKHILTASQSEAEKVLARLKKGEAFEQLVKEVSLDKESVALGGDLGMVYQDGYVARIGKDLNFINAVFQLAKDEISPVIKTAKGFHVVKVYDKEPDSYHALKDVESSIINILAGQKRVELRTKLMAELENKYKVERTYKN